MVLALSELHGHLKVGDLGDLRDASTRSHLADGRVVGWYGRPRVVIDAELGAQPVPTALAARYGRADFWRRWTRAECAAKIADVPMAMWLAQHGLREHWGTGLTIEFDGIVVTVAEHIADM